MTKIEQLNNVAPTELNKSFVQLFYYDIAPTEHKFDLENQIDQLVYQLYELTKEEIKIIEGNTQSPSGAT